MLLCRSLFQKANLRAKYYVFASFNFIKYIVLCLQNRAKTTKQQMVLKKTQRPQNTQRPSLLPPPIAYLYLHPLHWTRILETDFWVLLFRELCLASTAVKKDIKTFVKEHFANSFQKKMRFLHLCFCILLEGKVKIEPVKFFWQRCPLFPVSTDLYQ